MPSIPYERPRVPQDPVPQDPVVEVQKPVLTPRPVVAPTNPKSGDTSGQKAG